MKFSSAITELSGVHYLGRGRMLGVEDETGHLYLLDLDKEEIKRKIDFGKKGDYEDVELVGSDVWVLKSNGTLYRIVNWEEKDRYLEVYKTPLKQKNDTEGLAYDPETHSLLIACKGQAALPGTEALMGRRAVYRFDLRNYELIEKPFLLLNLDRVMDRKDLDAYERLSYALASKMDPAGAVVFQPSALAVHPFSKNIYLISNVGRLLLVLNRSGEILHMEHLSKKFFYQPEGLCFHRDGDMYIASEGDGGKPAVVKYKMQSFELE